MGQLGPDCLLYKSVKKFPLKAEDRLISQIFNNLKLLTPTKTIQLPIEYLWLNIDYDELPKNMWSKDKIYITHPECLTGEDRAFTAGAAKDRFPARYTSQISEKVHCRIKNMPFYEYIFFPNKSMISGMSQWIKVMSNMGLIKQIPFDKKYGEYNDIYQQNIKMLKNIKIKNNGLVYILSGKNVGLRNVHFLNNKRELVPTIIKYLENGNNVIYVPKNATKNMIERTKGGKYNLVCRNLKNNRVERYKSDYTLRIDET